MCTAGRSAFWVFGLKAMSKPLRCKFAGGIAGEAQGVGNRRTKKRIAQRIQHQRKRAFRHMVCVVADRQLRHEAANRIENGIERIPVAGDDHPGSESSGALFSEGVEALVDNDARVGFAGAGSFDGIGDAAVDGFCDGPCKLALQPGGGAEMVKQVRVGSADLACDGFQRHGLRALLDQQLARGCERGRAALFRSEASSSN